MKTITRVINGYKDPFLDKEAMQSSADDIYVEGSKFEWVFSLFQFDRELRQITFSYLIQAEAALKTATVYAFCEKHRGCSDYLNRSSFCSAGDMLTAKAFKGNKFSLHSSNMNKLMGVLSKKLVVGPATRGRLRVPAGRRAGVPGEGAERGKRQNHRVVSANLEASRYVSGSLRLFFT